jgi:hypothetical protein
MVGYASSKGYGLVDFELFMPEKWFGSDFAEKREKCYVPLGLEFKTKNQILSEMIRKLRLSGLFKGNYLGLDSEFGSDHAFLDSLPKELIYFADVHNDCHVFLGRPELVTQAYAGRGRRPKGLAPSFPSLKVKDIIANDSTPWNDVVLGNGAKGPIIAKDKCLKVVESRDGKPGQDVWLYARMLEDGKIIYALCNKSMAATLEEIRTPALTRWSIEQCFKECKQYLGMDHYEVRTWHGWRRHILLTLIAHLFTIKLRHLFGIIPDSPGPAPVVDNPVEARQYAEAAVRLQNNQEINQPKIHAYSNKPQYILTIGLLLKFINSMFVKIGKCYEYIEHELKSMYAAYESHAKGKVNKLIQTFGTP